MIIIDIKETVKRIFTDYLDKRGLRKTPERFAILEEIYSIQGVFDIELLNDLLQKRKVHISKATFYNTLDLLLECQLIQKLPQRGLNKYEKSYECVQRDHLICTNCGEIIEFCDPRIQEIEETASRLMNFDISYYSLHIYGICEKCKMKAKNGS